MTPVSQRGQLLVVALHALIALAVLGSATVLSALHIPINVEMATLYGAIVGLAGGGSAAVSALGTAVNGKAAVPPQLLADLNTTMRATVDHLAGSQQQVNDLRLAQAQAEPTPAPAVTV